MKCKDLSRGRKFSLRPHLNPWIFLFRTYTCKEDSPQKSNPGLLPNYKNRYLSVSPGVLVIPTSLNPGRVIFCILFVLIR